MERAEREYLRMLAEKLAKYDGTQEIVQKCLEITANYEKVVIFGAGVGGKALYNLLKQHGLSNRIIAWSDNNKLKYNTSYMEERLLVIKPESLTTKFGKEICILVASSAYDIIKEQLIKLGISAEHIFLFNFAFMDLDYTDAQFISAHIEDFNRAYNRMADDKSCEIFCDILNYRITKEESYLKKMQKYVDDEQYQYFDKELYKFVPDECFLDVGAYDGDTFCKFSKYYEEKEGWKHYYGLEADPNMYAELERNLGTASNTQQEKINLYNVAAWDDNTTLFFDSVAGSSTMMENKQEGQMKVKATKIDEVISGEVTFIKMDIEGAEYAALVGLKETIKKEHPILAICVYHKRDDFFNLTDLIEELAPQEYTFYIRQYRYTPTETVCYAIPKERVIQQSRKISC